MEKLVPLHIGLMGHIDHGKTALARVLSEKVSTAGLDKHPQSKRRGITIDLGFTMFTLDDKLVTLVDTPGHADLIRSVVAGANIIDAAILTVAADEGPMIQTGEHIVVLKAIDIETVIVAITKIDLVSEEKADHLEKQMIAIMADAGFDNVHYVRVSAHEEQGIDRLRDLLRLVTPSIRDAGKALLLPIDHAFSAKGHGTVVTGTVLEGSLQLGDVVTAMPIAKQSRVRSIQVFGESREIASAGDRIGVNIPDIDHQQLHRGVYLSKGNLLTSSNRVYAHLVRNRLYQGRITKKMVVTATIGMPTVTAELIPFKTTNNQSVIMDEVSGADFDCAILLQHDLAVYAGMQVLLMRTDLPPTSMRIVATGKVTSIPEQVLLYKTRKRIGKIHRIREDDVLVEELASSKQVAETLLGALVTTSSGITGVLGQPFGTRGVISAVFDGKVSLDGPVVYDRLVEEEF
ncbi:MAG: selenocysteine-specific translation elongation factor [Candidatus Thorarchaeota archaeon]